MAVEFEWRVALEQLGEQGQWIQLALAAEYVGLDGLWLAASAGAVDSLGVAGALCAHTRRLGLSVSVAPEVMLPAALANTLTSLQSISGERVTLYLPHPREGQLGRAFGEQLNLDQHHQRTAEYLEILANLFAPQGRPFDFHGNYFQLENAGHAQRLAPPRIILDQHQALPLLAAHADLCLLQCAAPPQLEQQIQRLRLAISPRAPGFALHLGIIVRETAEQAWDAALHSWRRNGIDVDPAASSRGVVLHARSHQPLRALEVYPQLYAPDARRPLQLVGSTAQIVARIEELHAMGVTRIVIDSEPAVAEVLRIGELLLPALDHLRPRRQELTS